MVEPTVPQLSTRLNERDKRGGEVINRAQSNKLWIELCTSKGRAWLPVLTDSMAPLIRPGDRILVYNVAPEQIGFGDIIVFRCDDDLIVHRVIKRWQDKSHLYFREKGDTRYTYGQTSAGEVIGRVTMVKGKGRMLNLTSPLSRLTNLALSSWIYCTTAIITVLRSSKSATIKGAGEVLGILSLLSSNLLVRVCFIVWYPAGLISRDGKEPDLRKAGVDTN
jgi:signal peptidase I